jgi:hypothetical protein
MHFEDDESLERWRELMAQPAPSPWQREYWRLSMWNWADWTVHGVILGGAAALVWWLL